ncbi:hypothetical protein T12_27 [Trichinella patagoniensis]|uniref:Uncharacterized protein n=1 Tax=Trichinella patagoniensis TaxID=990121 RepID=A0A0V0YYW5_9BILA|nr:hypothetical protein T12_27 [Trichinella patagoniensis]
MREKLRDGGGGSCHMRSSTQSSHIIFRRLRLSILTTLMGIEERYHHSESIKGGSIKVCTLANSRFRMSC